MILDLRTIYVVFALICTVLGVLQLLAYGTRRFETWPAWWGASNVLIGLGTFGTALRDILPDLVSVWLANVLLVAGYALLVISVRTFAGRAAFWRLHAVVLGLMAAALGFIWGESGDYLARIAFVSALCACFDAVVVRECWRLARRERLASAWILVAIFSLTVAIFLVRTGWALAGGSGSTVLFSAGSGPQYWMALVAGLFVTLRGFVLLLMAAERSQNLLLALSRQDPLTRAMNRNGLRTAYERIARPGSRDMPPTIVVLVIDIDHFKSINDVFGHTAGDAVLCLFADIARRELRGDDVLARQGGDEFVALLPGCTLEEAVEMANRLRTAFTEAAVEVVGRGTQATLSIGVAPGQAVPGGLDALLQQADEALYRSKREGRDRVVALAANANRETQHGRPSATSAN